MAVPIEQTSKEKFDVVIAGGGIYGACIAEKIAKAGYRTALLEASDFGAKTSSNSLGILHGGLRYLQHFNFKRIKRSVESRRYFLSLAPQLIEVIPFYIGLKWLSFKNPLIMRFALILNNIITRNRNLGLPSSVHIPNSRIIPKGALDKKSPLYQSTTPSIACWHEAVVQNTERLVLETILSAKDHGCVALNYCKVEKAIIEKSGFQGVQVKDRFTGRSYTIQARWLIDATGQKVGLLNSKAKEGSLRETKWARGSNIIVNRALLPSAAFAMPVRDQLKDDKAKGKGEERQLFTLPIRTDERQHTIIGTFYAHQDKAKAGLKLSLAEKQAILKAINTTQPSLNIKLNEVITWQSGWLPLKTNSSSDALQLDDHSTLKLHLFKQRHTQLEEQAHIQARRAIIEVRGVKFTTAPAVADDVLDILQSHFQLADRSRNTPNLMISDSVKPPRPKSDLQKLLFQKYGRRWEQAGQYFAKHQGFTNQLGHNTLIGEVCYAIDYEHAQRLTDVLCRRTGLAHKRQVSPSTAMRTAKIMQAKLAWGPAKFKLEIKQAIQVGLILE